MSIVNKEDLVYSLLELATPRGSKKLATEKILQKNIHEQSFFKVKLQAAWPNRSYFEKLPPKSREKIRVGVSFSVKSRAVAPQLF